MNSGQLTLKQEENLRRVKEKTNPFTLQKELNEKLKEFYDYLENYRPELKRVA